MHSEQPVEIFDDNNFLADSECPENKFCKKFSNSFKENIIIDTSNENIKEKNSYKLSFLDRFPFYRRLRKVNK